MKRPTRKESIIIIAVIGSVVAFTVLALVYRHNHPVYLMSGQSMEPLLANGTVLHTKRVSDGTNIANGDVAIVIDPTDTQKRAVVQVIGIPGDTITIKDGRLVVTKQGGEEYISFETKLADQNQLVLAEQDYYLASHNRSLTFGPNDGFWKLSRDQIEAIRSAE